jgi:hypothetical protein
MSNTSNQKSSNFHHNTVQHLTLIQGVINRMGTNSGLIKGFAALVVTSSMTMQFSVVS